MPTYADVKLLLPFDGSDGSTTFTDASSAARTVTVNGNAQIDTSQSQYGGAAGLFDGTGDYLTVADSTDFDFLLNADFTIECWVRFSSVGTSAIIFNQAPGTSFFPAQLWLSGSTGKIGFRGFDNAGSALAFDLAQTGTASTGVWYHVAGTRNGNTFTLWLDGVSQATASYSGSLYDTGSSLVIGAYGTGAFGVVGWLDDFRLTSGAWYTAGFTPTGPHPTSDGVNGHIAAAGPLGAPALLGSQSLGSILFAGPLGDPALLAVHAFGSILTAGPLGAPALVGVHAFGSILAAGPLGAPRLLGLQSFASVSAPTPLGAPALLAWRDFTPDLDPYYPQRYVMDLQTPDGLMRVPISSWQATIQANPTADEEAANYVQCVVPGCAQWLDAIAEATSFVISRVGRLADGGLVEYEMAQAPLDATAIDGGSTNKTATLSGYAPGLPVAADNPDALFDRTLTNVRQDSIDGANRRARADIDWLLRPGQRAFVQGSPMIVRYINYYVSGTDQSMFVGSQST